MHKTIEKIREFNRFYMPSMNLLGNHYLGSEYSITEARIFFEIYEHEGCKASQITEQMNIDKSYLSRIIKNHEKHGYIIRKKTADDKRSYRLYLTENGKKRAEEFIQKSNEDIASIIAHLSPQECNQLSEAIDTIQTILKNGHSER